MTAVLDQPAAVADTGAWRRLLMRSVLLPGLVLAPLTTLAMSGDHRFNVYWHGSTVVARPWTLVTANLRTVPLYLDFGNFRPLGRMLEWTVDLTAYVLVAVLHVPAEIALRLVAALAAAVLTAAAALFAEAVTARGRMFAAPPPASVALVPLALAGCLVAAGPLSTTVLFGGLYYLSAALVLGVAAWIARGPRRFWPVLLAGAALAAFNEVGALALPLATVVAVVRSTVLWTRPKNCRTGVFTWPHPVLGWGGRRSRNTLDPEYRTKFPIRAAAYLWLGFLPVFLPIRVLIFLACRGGDCYRASALALGPSAAAALPDRLTAWLPPVQWLAALRGAGTPSRLTALAALLVFAVVATRMLADLRRLPGLDRRQAAALALAGGTLLLLGAALGSASPQAQTAHWGEGWRDSGLTATGGTLLTVALLALLSRSRSRGRGRSRSRTQRQRQSRNRSLLVATALLALAATASTAANQAYAVQTNRRTDSQLNNAIATEIAQFDDSTAGQARRCALKARFAALYPDGDYSRFAQGELPGTHSPTDRLEVTASMATEQMNGRPFC